MKNFIVFVLFLSISFCLNAQYEFSATSEFPYGRLNPEAPEETTDFEPMIGISDCTSEQLKADRTWGNPVDMIWKFRYIMNGMGVQDETLRKDGRHGGNIRQYSKDSTRWYIRFYSYAAITSVPAVWEGNKKGDNIVLYKEHKAPNGTDGFYRLTFSDISDSGFNWAGEWVDKTEKIVFPTWKIKCRKRKK